MTAIISIGLVRVHPMHGILRRSHREWPRVGTMFRNDKKMSRSAVEECRVRSTEYSGSLQSLRSLRAMRAMHAMQPGRGECNDATTSAKVMDRVVKSHWELVGSTQLSLDRRCGR